VLRSFAPFSDQAPQTDCHDLQGAQTLLDLARRAPAKLAVVVIAAIAVFSACTPLNSQEQHLFNEVNRLRMDQGLQPVYEHEELTAKARQWAGQLAASGRLAHQDLRALGVSWSSAAENVGRSSSIEDVYARLLASPSHKANMLNGAYQYTGIGTARGKDGSVYAVQLFIRA
jgi:uncharacterized protein YkwD